MKKHFNIAKKACDLGGGIGCFSVSIAYYFGEGVKKDLKTAIKFLTKSCNLEYGGGCGMLGAMYHDGYGVKQNLSKAKEVMAVWLCTKFYPLRQR